MGHRYYNGIGEYLTEQEWDALTQDDLSHRVRVPCFSGCGRLRLAVEHSCYYTWHWRAPVVCKWCREKQRVQMAGALSLCNSPSPSPGSLSLPTPAPINQGALSLSGGA